MRVLAVLLLLLLLQDSTPEALVKTLKDGARIGDALRIDGDPMEEDGVMPLDKPVEYKDDGRDKREITRVKHGAVIGEWDDRNNGQEGAEKMGEDEGKAGAASRAKRDAGEQEVCDGNITLDYGESVVLHTKDDTSRDRCNFEIRVPKGAVIGFDCSLFDLNKKGCKAEKLWLKGVGKRQGRSFHCKTNAPDGVVFPSTNVIRVRYNRKEVRPNKESDGFICKVYTVGDPTTEITTPPTTTTMTTSCETCCMLGGVEYADGYHLTQDNYCLDVRCTSGNWALHDPLDPFNPDCSLTMVLGPAGFIRSFDESMTPFSATDCAYSLVQEGSSDTPTNYVYFNFKDDPNNPGQAIMDKFIFGDMGEVPVTCPDGDIDGCSFGSVLEAMEVTAAGTLAIRFNIGSSSLPVLAVMGANKMMAYIFASTLFVYAPNSIQNQVAGLCGPWNGDQSDDLATRQGVVTTDIAVFLNSWKTSTMCVGG